MKSGIKPIFRKFRFLSDEAGIAAAFIIELIVFAQLSPFFFTTENLLNVSLQASITAIIAVGMTFVILTAGIDLSVGSLVAVVGVVSASLLTVSDSFTISLITALAAGLAIGAFSGFAAGLFITRFNITPFIVTLALMTIWRGAAFVYTDGRPVWNLPEAFGFLGNGRILGIPFPSVVMIFIFIIAYIVLKYTRFGRYVYAAGGNIRAAKLAGVNTKLVLISVYMISGILAAVGGILLTSRINSGQPNSGLMYELDVIAAVAVGGTSFFGGRGSIIGTFIGAMLIAVLRNGLNLMNVGSYVQQVIVGLVILIAVMIDQIKKEKE